MPIIPLDDADDPRCAPYRDIRERDLVGRQGLFVAEGTVVLEALLRAPAFEALSCLVLDSRLPGLTEKLRNAPPDLPIYVVPRALMDEIAGFPIHRGVLALGRRRPDQPALDIATLPPRALVLVLVGIANHDNVGALFRNAAAFSADAVFLDPTCCDPLYRKAIRVSVGGVFRTPFARFAETATFCRQLAAAGFTLFGLSPKGVLDIRDVSPAGRTALVLGSEGLGLPAEILGALQTMRIPIADGFDSLNVATAAAIALHRMATPNR